MLYLILFRRGATDWVNHTKLGYDTTGGPLSAGFQPNWHHIFPRSVLKKAKVKDDDINFFGNITVLNERTNVRQLAAKEPARYITDFKIEPEILRAHLVPEEYVVATKDSSFEKQWDLANYNDFVFGRTAALTKATNDFLLSLR